MAASSRYDMASGSPDGPAYLNGQRGPYVSASLEKSGSFREGADSRNVSSHSGLSRPGSALSQGDPSNQLHALLSDLKPVVLDQKFPRPGEMKRSISNILGISPEDSIPATISMRPLPSSALDDIRRMKSNLNDFATKARDRAKAFGEALSKFDKYSHGSTRKRSRADISSGDRPSTMLPGGTIPRTGQQSHLTACGPENAVQKLEERAKSAIPSRRVRTARMVDGRMDARVTSITRPSGSVDRDKDTFKLVNGGAALSEEKGRALPTGVDGWEKKMRKKRSTIKSDVSPPAVLSRSLESDREPKRALQQKLVNDARLRLNNTHGFRSGPVAAVPEIGKSDSVSQQNGHGIRPFPRNDQDNGSLPFDRRDRPVVSDKDGAAVRNASKSNGREDNCAASPTATVQVNASARGPRSNSGSLSKASPNIHKALGNSDDWEHPQCVSKLNATVGSNNRKRSTSNCSPSPPVAQWVGQRPQKITRVARRSNLTPVITGHDEISASDMADNASINEDGVAFTRRSSSNASQQPKLKGDHAPLSGLSESEDPGSSENKSKDKSKKSSGMEERAGSTHQKVATLPPRKNKVGIDDLGDGIRRQGRIGRGFALTRSGMPTTSEKPDSAQWGSSRIGSDSSEKIESKPGRPPNKKWSERKGHTRLRHSANNAINKLAGESDDDHEELLAAANAALNTRHACFSSFWKQMEPVFGFLSEEDTVFLNQQSHLMDEAAVSNCVDGDGQNLKGDLGGVSLQSTPTLGSRDDCCAVTNRVSLDECGRDIGLGTQTKQPEPFLEQLVRENWSPNGVSICQALLSAIIEDEEVGSFNYSNSIGEYLCDDAHGIHFEFDEELVSKRSNMNSPGTFLAPERVSSNGYRIDAGGYHAELAYEKLGSNGFSLKQHVEGHALDELFPNQTTACISRFSELQYNQMPINDRILLELSEIGLYPEPVPDLAQGEEEEIVEGIGMLEEKRKEQVMRGRYMLSKLEKTVMEAREQQQRELERIALDKLVGAAYKKYMACWGPNASGSKNVNKVTKRTALAFARRTLARYQKFEETGSGCFNEPSFRDIFLSVSSRNGSIDKAADGEAANHLAPTLCTETTSADYDSSLASRPVQRLDIHDCFQSVNHLSEQMIGREDPGSNKVKKRELLLDDVVGVSAGTFSRDLSGLGNSLVRGAKGKRSERERDGKGQNRDAVSAGNTGKMDWTDISNLRGERKNRAKPKQKTAQLSASVNGLLSKSREVSSTMLISAPNSHATGGGSTKKDDSGLFRSHVGMQGLSNDSEANDLCNWQLPDLDGDLGGNGQDICAWLTVDEDGLEENDFMKGLDIPMDDLSEVMMM